MEFERRKEKRRKFTYYLRVLDASSLQAIGYLTEISSVGIQIDCERPIPVGVNYRLRMELTSDIANKTHMIIHGRTKWCQADKLAPNGYNVGFEVSISARDDAEIFGRMLEKYGAESHR
jgi:hypothetical protein